MLGKYLWLILPLIAFYVLKSYDYYRDTILTIIFGLNVIDTTVDSSRLFTVNELRKYTNFENGLYLAILGRVFDVTKGAKHYGPDGSYHAFTGTVFILFTLKQMGSRI